MGNIVYQKLPLYNTQARIIFFHINKDEKEIFKNVFNIEFNYLWVIISTLL